MQLHSKEINIIGHKNPDTDSICSAIAYAWLKIRSRSAREALTTTPPPRRADQFRDCLCPQLFS